METQGRSASAPAPGEVWRGDGASLATSRWYIGDWLVEPGANRIAGPAGETHIEPKVMHVLLCLGERPGETVSVEHLLHTVWGPVIVEENTLRRAISQLRKAFGDDARAPRVIQTISKKGYRLIAPVTRAHRGDAYPSTVEDLTLTPTDYAPRSTVTLHTSRHWRYLWAVGLASLIVGGLAWVALWRPSASIAPMTKVPLSSFSGVELSPALSPDGSRIAFVWEGEDGASHKIYVKHLDADVPQRLTNSPGRELSPAWSPEGHQVAYLRYSEDGCGLFMATVPGAGERKMVDCLPGVQGHMAWSPDGAWMALAARDPEDDLQRLYLLSVETLSWHAVTTPPSGYADIDPVFSPSGEHLSFMRYRRGQEALYIVPVVGGDPVQVVAGFGDLEDQTWTPEGHHLVFSSNKGGNYRLWRVPAAGGTPEWLAAVGTYDPSTPTFARQGGRMAYIEWFFDFNIWRVATASAEDESLLPERWISSSKWELHPQFSPEAGRLAFTSNRTGSNELWVADHDGRKPIRLTRFDTAFVSTPRWAPDGRWLAVEVRKEAMADVYIVDAAGGSPQQLTTHAADDVAPSWSPDGDWVYFGSRRSGAWQIWKKPVAGGPAVQVTEDGGVAALPSADGRFLYYTKATAHGLWRRSLEGGEEVLVFEGVHAQDWGSWVLHQDGVYFVRRTRQDVFLSFFDFAREQVRDLAEVEAPIPMNKASLSASPDGAYLLYTQTDRRESDIMLVEDFR